MPPPSSQSRRAAVYVRISKDATGAGLGVQRQESECRELADRLGWVVADVYVDNDLSASSGKPRPQYVRMLDDMARGRVDAVIAWHPDRLTRQPKELESLIGLADERGVVFSTCRAGDLDLSTSSGRLVARLLGAVARHEAELKGERQSAKAKQLAEAGWPSGGGTRPFGWAHDRLTLEPAEAAVIRSVAERALAGEAVTSLAEDLIRSGVPTVTGAAWSPTVLRRLLLAPRLAGLSTWQGEIVGKARWEPILDETTWRRLMQVLSGRGRPRRQSGRVAYLAGLIWCGRCGYELITFQQSRGSGANPMRSYGCRTRYAPGKRGYGVSCGQTSIKAEWVEDDVAERILGRLAKPANVSRMAARGGDDKAAAAAESMVGIELRLAELGRDYADGLLGRTEFLAARDRLAEHLSRVQVEAGAPKLELPYGDVAALADWWNAAPVGKRQALARQQITRLDVGPHAGRRSDYDESRLTITWR